MKIKGFTLLELIITLAILALLSSLSVVSYSHFIRKNEYQLIADELKTAVQYAKIQALILGKPVFLSPMDASLNWAKGMVLSTKNKQILYQWQWNHPRLSLTWNGVRAADKISFSPNPANAISNGHFTLTNIDTQQSTAIILNRLGRIRVSNNLSLLR